MNVENGAAKMDIDFDVLMKAEDIAKILQVGKRQVAEHYAMLPRLSCCDTPTPPKRTWFLPVETRGYNGVDREFRQRVTLDYITLVLTNYSQKPCNPLPTRFSSPLLGTK